jgi:hypothetical protein
MGFSNLWEEVPPNLKGKMQCPYSGKKACGPTDAFYPTDKVPKM